jgi:hypothetical protein
MREFGLTNKVKVPRTANQQFTGIGSDGGLRTLTITDSRIP